VLWTTGTRLAVLDNGGATALPGQAPYPRCLSNSAFWEYHGARVIGHPSGVGSCSTGPSAPVNWGPETNPGAPWAETVIWSGLAVG
jgi:hypothetical protein